MKVANVQFQQHFELVSESSLQDAQSSLLSEIQPEVSALLGRVETHLDKLERREQSLIAKAELQEGRLNRTSSASLRTSKSPARGNRPPAELGLADNQQGGLTALEELKLTQMRQKKERLSYAVGRLELQAGQRERQLRKSMAFQ